MDGCADLGETRVIDLIPNGRDVAVTRSNLVRYIHLMANYRLNVSIKPQCDAFMRGFEAVLSRDLLQIFNSVRRTPPR